VREDHLKLKVGGVTRVYACVVHGDEFKNFHRRTYWDLDPEKSKGLVLVHYLDTESGRRAHSSGCMCLRCRYVWSGPDAPAGPEADLAPAELLRTKAEEPRLPLQQWQQHQQSPPQHQHLLPLQRHQRLEPLQDLFSDDIGVMSKPTVVDASLPHSEDDFVPFGEADYISEFMRDVDFADVESPTLGNGQELQQPLHQPLQPRSPRMQAGMVVAPSHPVLAVSAADLVVENFAPECVDVRGGKLLINLVLRASVNAAPTAALAAAPAAIPHMWAASCSVRVVLGAMPATDVTLGANGVVCCRAPPMALGSTVPLTVLLEDAAVPATAGLALQVRYVSYHFSQGNLDQAAAPAGAGTGTLPALGAPATQPPKYHTVAPPPVSTGVAAAAPRSILKRKWNRVSMLTSSSPAGSRSSSSSAPGLADQHDDTDVDHLTEEELSELSESMLERVVRVLVQFTTEETDFKGEMDALDESGFNLLHYTVAVSNDRLVGLLLEHGADPNTRTSAGDAPLHLAAETGDAGIAQRLEHAGADVCALDAEGQSCAALAARYNYARLAAWFDQRAALKQGQRQAIQQDQQNQQQQQQQQRGAKLSPSPRGEQQQQQQKHHHQQQHYQLQHDKERQQPSQEAQLQPPLLTPTLPAQHQQLQQQQQQYQHQQRQQFRHDQEQSETEAGPGSQSTSSHSTVVQQFQYLQQPLQLQVQLAPEEGEPRAESSKARTASGGSGSSLSQNGFRLGLAPLESTRQRDSSFSSRGSGASAGLSVPLCNTSSPGAYLSPRGRLSESLDGDGMELDLGSPSQPTTGNSENMKDSREDREEKMLRKALASMSLKERCALSLSAADGTGGAEFAGSAVDGVGVGSGKARALAEDGSALLPSVISAMHDDERSELELEARVIQANFRRWMLRRNILAARRVQSEASDFFKEKDQRQQSSTGSADHDEWLDTEATKIQAATKGYLARKKYNASRGDVIQVQAAARSLLARRHFLSWRRQLSATLVIQKSFRAHQVKMRRSTPTHAWQQHQQHQHPLAQQQLLPPAGSGADLDVVGLATPHRPPA
jgi:hypothetical protein